MQVLRLLSLVIEVMLWVGLAIVGMSRWSWAGALLSLFGIIAVWAVFMSPRGPWRLPPWPRAFIGLGLCVAVGMLLVDEGWPRYGFSLAIGGILLGVAELVLPDIRGIRRQPTSTRLPYGM